MENKKERKVWRPIMVSKAFYDDLELLRAELRQRTLSGTLEIILNNFNKDKKVENKND